MARRRLAVLLAGVLAASSASAVAPTVALAEHPDPPERVTLMGSLMSELGCPTDWDEACKATDLSRSDGTWSLTGEVPAGVYELKVRLDGSWSENYGAGGVADGPNIPLALSSPAELRFTWDETSHRVTVAPADPAAPGVQPSDAALAQSSLRKDLTREQFYFVMADRFENGRTDNDTGGFGGDRLQHGFDPTDKAFFHGGDLKGIIDRLDYIEGLGTTAIWMTPSFKNKPVQGSPGNESAGYHGYWITDFTQIDPHLGTNEELKQLIDLAHSRGIKVFFDIITNHTADVLDYDPAVYSGPENNETVPYVSKEQEPYRDASGTPFDDRDFAMGDKPFPAVDAQSFPYMTAAKPGEESIKVPTWLNDPLMYHNRGTSTFAGEDAMYGDFPGGDRQALDDLWTERPEVVQGMVDIYRTWVEEFGVDGFRIDTVKHVNMDFWKQFGPALQGYAANAGNDDFFMFGEVYDADPRFMSQYTTTGRLQATVDFGFQGSGTNFAKGRPTTELRDFFASDDWFTDADSNAYSLPTFLGNHDMGRVGKFLADGGATGGELLRRDQLAHELMYLTRGQPVVYYGDEQGFVGDGGDQDAREDMFASQVRTYNDNDLIGTDATTAQSNFDTTHPMYRTISSLSALRKAHPALADGAQVHRYASGEAGVYAFSRIDAQEQVEHVVASNNATTAKTVTLPTFQQRMMFTQLWPATGKGKPVMTKADAEGRLTVTVPPLSTLVLRANERLAADPAAPSASFRSPGAGGTVGGRAEVAVQVAGDDLHQVTFAYREVGTSEWTVLGTDDNAPYRVFHDVRDLARGTLLEYRAVVRDREGQLAVANTVASVGDPAPPAAGGGGSGGVGPVTQPAAVSVPGSHGSEQGCAPALATAGGDWEPGCDAVQLTLDQDDKIWKGTLQVPAGQYEYKAALNRTWDVNYGAGATQNGSNIVYTSPGGAVTFYYDHRTNHVWNTASGPVVTAVGDFQSEMGCAGDWQPDCMVTWLQDPDADGTFELSLKDVPAGTYQVKATHGLSFDENYGAGGAPDGDDIVFTVPADGLVTTLSYDLATHLLSVSTRKAGAGADLSTSRATWVAADLVAWDVQDDLAEGLTYRLHYGPAGSLAIDAETLGGSSVPLVRDAAGLPTAVVTQYPDLEGADALRLSKKDAREAARISASPALAVAAYDHLGRLVDATAVDVAAWSGRG